MMDARQIAVTAHGDQMYGREPYMVHVDAVVDVLRSWEREDLVVAGYLHDVLEDTPVTADDLLDKGVSLYDVRLIEAVTGRGKNRRERKADIMRKLKSFPDAIPVKVADRIVNMRTSKVSARDKYEMYVRELPEFVELREFGGDDLMWGQLLEIVNS